MSEQYIRVPKAALAKLKYLSRNSRAIYDFLCDSINSNKWNLNGYGAVYLSDIEAFTDIKCKNIYKNLDKIQELGLIHTIDFDELRGVKFFILYKKDYESDFEEIQKGNYLIKNNGIYILKSGNFLEYSLRKSHNKPSTQSQNTEYNNTPNRVINYSKQSTEILQTEYDNTLNRVIAPLLNKDIDSVSESPTKLPTKSITKFTTKPLTKGEVKEEVEEVGGVDLKKVVEEVEEKDFLELIKNLPPIDLPKPKVQVKELDFVKSDLNKSSGGAAASFSESKPDPNEVDLQSAKSQAIFKKLMDLGLRSNVSGHERVRQVESFIASKDQDRLAKVIESVIADSGIPQEKKAGAIARKYEDDKFKVTYEGSVTPKSLLDRKALQGKLTPIAKLLGVPGLTQGQSEGIHNALAFKFNHLLDLKDQGDLEAELIFANKTKALIEEITKLIDPLEFSEMMTEVQKNAFGSYKMKSGLNPYESLLVLLGLSVDNVKVDRSPNQIEKVVSMKSFKAKPKEVSQFDFSEVLKGMK